MLNNVVKSQTACEQYKTSRRKTKLLLQIVHPTPEIRLNNSQLSFGLSPVMIQLRAKIFAEE